mmetsp:Transcript_38345/g.28234  ORF Transcript_38345/g.28234 Transcript_38345/m.28234 type:complete len:146 (-) Transcript_38345:15-452(-)
MYRKTSSLELEEEKRLITELNSERVKKSSVEIFQSISPKTIQSEIFTVERSNFENALNSKENEYRRPSRNLVGTRTKAHAYCPRCDATRLTEIKLETTGIQWCCCLSMCVICLVPFCLVPLCIKRCYNVKHFCSACKIPLGISGV